QSALLSSLAYTFAIRPPHAPTLFPYTTLFRSPLLEYDLPDRCDLVQYLIALHLLQRRDHFVPCLLLGKLIIMGFQCLILRPVAADRKSTRLNSSHVKISYAVFCLKKKNYHACR